MNLLAVALAALGALFFGLAAVRQHRAVRAASGLRLLTQPAWLLGAGQAGLGGGLHVLALAIAPITLVQPVGVLAVPVTVVASALARRRRPSRSQTVGALLSVAGVAALTVVLLLPAGEAATLPAWGRLASGAGAVLVGGLVVALLLGRAWAPALLRCVSRSVVAAALFGLVSVLVRTLGQVVRSTAPTDPALVATAVVGIALALPLGVWAMQSAYLFGAPQVVICCLTLVDPLTAVVGGRSLLRDGSAITGPSLAAAIGCALVAAAGVVLLARDYPADPAVTDAPRSGRDRGREPPTIRAMAQVGAVVRRGEEFGVVVAVKDSTFDVIEVEWDDGSTEWVKIADVEWIVSRE
ncbi:MAG: DMT family transporter [Janthinobacterium lividum]